MRNLLYKIKAKDGDGISHCSSSKNDTYMGMLKDIDNKGQVTINESIKVKRKYNKNALTHKLNYTSNLEKIDEILDEIGQGIGELKYEGQMAGQGISDINKKVKATGRSA